MEKQVRSEPSYAYHPSSRAQIEFEQRTDDRNLLPETVLGCTGFSGPYVSQGISEVPLDHFRCLDALNEAWWCSESWMNIDITDVIDVAAY